MSREKLTDAAEVLLRHVNPVFMRDGRPSSQAFSPTKKDEGLLSVNRGSMTTAADAFELFTSEKGLGLRCEGTWGISVGECANEELSALSDPLTNPPEKVDNHAHAVVDFRELPRKRAEAKGAKLLRCALARGRLHPPITTDESNADAVSDVEGDRRAG